MSRTLTRPSPSPRPPNPRRPARADSDRRREPPAEDRYPALFAWGKDSITYLSTTQAQRATPEERIRSVWPYAVRKVLQFCDTLRTRAAANYDPEDVIHSLYVVLREKDARWDPRRGNYIAFVCQVVKTELHRIRDRAGTIHAPRNAASRIKEYERDRQTGRLTTQKATTLAQIRHAFADHESLDPRARELGVADWTDPETALDEPDPQLLRAFIALPWREAYCLRENLGLFGAQETRELATVARQLGVPTEDAAQVRARARARLRAALSPSETQARTNDGG